MEKIDGEVEAADWREEWKTFGRSVSAPWVLIPALATIALMTLQWFLLSGTAASVSLSVLLTVLITIFSAIAGNRLERNLSTYNEATVLFTRGQSAIRDLKLLLSRVSTLGKRAHLFSESSLYDIEVSSAKNAEVARHLLQVLREDTLGLREQIISAMEDWQDIVPQARNLNYRIDELTELARHKEQLEVEIDETKTQLSSANDRVRALESLNDTLASEKDDFDRERTNLDAELVSLRNQLVEKKDKLGKISDQLAITGDPFTRSIVGTISTSPLLDGSAYRMSHATAPALGNPDGIIRVGESGTFPYRSEYLTTSRDQCTCGHEYTLLDSILDPCPKCGKRRYSLLPFDLNSPRTRPAKDGAKIISGDLKQRE